MITVSRCLMIFKQLTCCIFLLPVLACAQDRHPAPIYQAPMTWLDDQGRTVSLKQWQGKPVIITMAYSSCRKFCPMTVARLNEIQRGFDQRQIAAEFVVISYDPANDNWQSWANYRKTHHIERENWHFLTGTPENTKAVSELLGMPYWLYDDHVMHNFKILRLGINGDTEASLDWDNQQNTDSLLPR